jgi:hypothetical protein
LIKDWVGFGKFLGREVETFEKLLQFLELIVLRICYELVEDMVGRVVITCREFWVDFVGGFDVDLSDLAGEGKGVLMLFRFVPYIFFLS